MTKTNYFLIALIILCFVGNLYASNYYLSTASSGSGTGTSWTNTKAYTSFSFSSLAAGDTVFFDGGTDSVRYDATTISNLSPSSIVVITKGKETGHNGKVIFSRTSVSTTSSRASLQLTSCSNVSIEYITIKKEVGVGSVGSDRFFPAMYFNNSHNCFIDNCEVYSNGYGDGISTNACYNISITNNHVEIYPNTVGTIDQCTIALGGGTGGHTIIGNTLIQGQNVGSPTVSVEFIYMGSEGGTDATKPLTTIANNFMLWDAPGTGDPSSGVAALYYNMNNSNSLLIYNNIIKMNLPQPAIFTVKGTNSGYHTSLRFFNNTIYSKSNNYEEALWVGDNMDTLIVQNNIFNMVRGKDDMVVLTSAYSGFSYVNFDYNRYYYASTYTSNSTFMKDAGTERSWSYWQTTNGQDLHSSSGTVIFSNAGGDNVVDYKLNAGSAGIGAGTDLSTYFTTDIIGTPRPQGTAWDMGAFQISAATAPATTYYVANNGNDANSGTSTTSPWKTISKVNSTTFNPGDNILFRRGDTWSEILTPQGSGNASNPITYDAYGTGNLPIIDGGTINNNCISIISANYITIRNFRVQYAAVNTNGDIHAQYTDHLIIENCDCYITSHGGVFVESSTNVYIGNCTMSSPVSNNNNQADGIYSQRNSNSIYENNSIIISDMGTAHNDGIQSYLDTNMTFRNNYIYQNNSLTQAQGIDVSDAAGTFYVYNNVVKCPNSNANIIGFNNDVSGTGALRCYQNSVLGNVYCLRVLKCSDIAVQNNIFYTNSDTSIIDIGNTLNSGSQIDYNLYNRSGSGSMVYYEPQGHMTYAQWQAAGFESHGLNTNPVVNDTLYPAINSPVINAGANLGGIYSYDKEGTLRPLNAVDLGAYEVKSSTVPVELTSFSGVFINNSVQLTWSTATETNNKGFEIEKNNNSTWEDIGFVEGKGNSTTKNDYSFEDKNPIGYTLQYRLKQIDNNGNFKYSDVVSITAIPTGFSVQNYPNPFNPTTKIRYTVTSESMINLVIYNIIGERIDELKNEQQQPGTYEINWNGNGHPSGIYLLSIIESPINGSTHNSKTIKMDLIK